MDLSKITRPSLLLDERKCRKNIGTMAAKAKASGIEFRPHFKTHQSHAIGRWFREEGVNKITVSSVTMAEHFASDGWNDITIAFPANQRELGKMKNISELSKLNILFSNFEHLKSIDGTMAFEAGGFIKVNTGNNRSGIEWNDYDQITRMAESMKNSKTIRMKGFLTHAGHAYKAKSKAEIAGIYTDTVTKLNSARSSLSMEDLITSSGDTPSCSIISDFKDIDEIRPGNFVFYDLMQYRLGSCNAEQIAVAVACPVVEKNLRRSEIIIYGGGVHLSKDNLQSDDGSVVFGQVVILTSSGWDFPVENIFVRSISQEHGIIPSTRGFFNSVKTGDLIGIIPVHSCMTADLLRQYHTFDGNIISDFSPK